MARHNVFNLQVQVGDSGSSIYPIAGDLQDDYADFESAEAQACVLSALPRIPVRVWGGKVEWLDMKKENAGVVIVNVGRWAVVSKCHNGIPVGWVPQVEVFASMTTEQLITLANALDGGTPLPELGPYIKRTLADVRSEIAARPKKENWLYE